MISVDRVDDNWLAHYRTKGSENGKRLYQNPDGTYTELGKERRRKNYGEMRRDAKEVGKEFAKRANQRSGLSGFAQSNKQDIQQLQREASQMDASDKVQKFLKVAGTVATAGLIAAKIYDVANNGKEAFNEVRAKKIFNAVKENYSGMSAEEFLKLPGKVQRMVSEDLKTRNAGLGALKTYQNLTK